MQQQVGVGSFLQGGLKGINQAMRQISNKSNRIGDRSAAASLPQIQLTCSGV